MSREILDCLKRERDICVKNVIHSQNTAFMFTPALRVPIWKTNFCSRVLRLSVFPWWRETAQTARNVSFRISLLYISLYFPPTQHHSFFRNLPLYSFDVLVTFRPPCLCPSGHKHGVSIQSSINLGDTLLRRNAQMKNRRDLILGDVVYIAVIYYIPDSWIYLLNGYDF